MIFLETIPIIPLKISYKWKDLILQTLKYASAYVKEHKEEFIAKVRANASIQQIDIYLKFVGKLDVPMSELTPEHWKEEERKRKSGNNREQKVYFFLDKFRRKSYNKDA